MSEPQAPPAPQPFLNDAADRADEGRGLPRRGRGLALRTLIVLRWLAIAGQTAAITVLEFALHFPLPVHAVWTVVAASLVMNVATMLRLKTIDGRRADGRETAKQLGFDIVQLSVLLSLTGGLENPFCLLLVAPVTVAAAALPARQAILLGFMVLLATVGLFFWSMPLPWQGHEVLELPLLYRFGMGLALATGVVFTAGYAWRVSADAEKLELALAATQGVLEREQRLAALGGLAAAAGHELGTPLATIQVVAKELLRASPPGSPAAEDAALLLQQAERCRDILKRLSQRPEDGDAIYADVSLAALLEEVIAPHRGIDVEIEADVVGEAIRVRRLPEIIHALSALVENAADFATAHVDVTAEVTDDTIQIAVVDDGPGFAADILQRLGEPYVTSRPHGKQKGRGRKKAARQHAPGGMGLGFFIARTLLERTGGTLTIGSGDGGKGARVEVRWPRATLETS